MKGTPLALGLTLLVGSVAALVWPQRMVAPGALNEGHVRLADTCLACHVPFAGPSANKCLSCHPLHAIGVQMTTGQPRQPQRPRTPLVHRAMVDAGAACDACHAEHSRGPARSLSFRHDALSRGGAHQLRRLPRCRAARRCRATRQDAVDMRVVSRDDCVEAGALLPRRPRRPTSGPPVVPAMQSKTARRHAARIGGARVRVVPRHARMEACDLRPPALLPLRRRSPVDVCDLSPGRW